MIFKFIGTIWLSPSSDIGSGANTVNLVFWSKSGSNEYDIGSLLVIPLLSTRLIVS